MPCCVCPVYFITCCARHQHRCRSRPYVLVQTYGKMSVKRSSGGIKMQKTNQFLPPEREAGHFQASGRRKNRLFRVATALIPLILLLTTAGCAGPETSVTD